MTGLAARHADAPAGVRDPQAGLRQQAGEPGRDGRAGRREAGLPERELQRAPRRDAGDGPGGGGIRAEETGARGDRVERPGRLHRGSGGWRRVDRIDDGTRGARPAGTPRRAARAAIRRPRSPDPAPAAVRPQAGAETLHQATPRPAGPEARAADPPEGPSAGSDGRAHAQRRARDAGGDGDVTERVAVDVEREVGRRAAGVPPADSPAAVRAPGRRSGPRRAPGGACPRTRS